MSATRFQLGPPCLAAGTAANKLITKLAFANARFRL
jgi:hypothetical protein